MKKAKTERIDMLETPRKEIVKFLEKNGWNVLVAGRSGVRGVNNGKFGNYTYEFEFSGKKKRSDVIG